MIKKHLKKIENEIMSEIKTMGYPSLIELRNQLTSDLKDAKKELIHNPEPKAIRYLELFIHHHNRFLKLITKRIQELN